MTDLRNMTSKELKEIAKEKKVKNWWTLKKEVLIAEIEASEEQEVEETEEINEEEAYIAEIMQQKKDLGIECPKINSEEVEIVEVNECDNNIVDSESSETEEKFVPNRGALITYDGKSQNLSAWSKELGLSHQTLYGRLYIYGWSVEKAFTTKRKEVK
jgi:hypothetical protein